jgi:hypothetical protein
MGFAIRGGGSSGIAEGNDSIDDRRRAEPPITSIRGSKEVIDSAKCQKEAYQSPMIFSSV